MEIAAPVTSLPIYIPDRTYPDEEDKSDEFKAELEAEYELSTKYADIWPGASFPAFLMELSVAAWPYLAMVIYVFFKGKEIKDNLDAWTELLEKITPFRKHRPYFKREGAAVLAVAAVTQALGAAAPVYATGRLRA